jgi:23S rRNA (cytidine1920-2'-O)/16S rRNA (cytidine1409-2'-O)-methyltransferase
VTAIDVGHGQLAQQLRPDPRVTHLEGVNARDLDARQIAEPVQFITADVSFISLKLALPSALALAERGAKLVALIKPQFEAGRERPNHAKICKDIAAGIAGQGWRVLGMVSSPIAGGDGDREYLIAAEKPC